MSGYILETLFPTGWRRTGEIFWRFADAEREANRRLADDAARAVRILSVLIGTCPVYESIRSEPESNVGGTE